MNKMIFVLLTSLSLFGNVISFDIENVMDLAINHKGSTILAYPSIRNEEILKGNDVRKYGQLQWHSIGHPTLISRNSSFSIANVFEIAPFGFDILIEVLTDTQREMFKEKVMSQYGIDVETSQIQNLIPTELNCSTEVLCSNGTSLTLYGKGKSLTMHTLKVKFDAKIGSEKIECFEHHLIEYNQLDVDCVIRKKSKNVNTFSITWEQISKSNLLIKLFGNANEVYVTHQQMADLASEIHQLMNVYKEYELNVREFSLKFINGLINQMVADFKPVPIDIVIKSLSKYSTKDLDPNIIKKHLSKVLKVKIVGDKKHIIANNEYSKSNSDKHHDEMGTSVKGEYAGFSASASFNYVKEKEQSWSNSSKSLDDQLKELNSHSKDNIEWEIEGEKIVPKSLKVSQIFKTDFNEKRNFEWIKRFIDGHRSILDIEFLLQYKKGIYKQFI